MLYHNLSSRMENLQSSPIRDILAVLERSGMISFAGGLPAPDSFPSLDNPIPAEVLQYGPTEGEQPLRQFIAEKLAREGIKCSPDQILILSGSQQGIDLVAKMTIDQGTPVLVESPTYLAALQVFRLYAANILPFEIKDQGSIIAGLSQARLAYIIPTFQNPTGYCYSKEERMEFASKCDAANVIVFEDDPYRDLMYDQCERKPVCAYLKSTSWIYQGSFSKTFAPGLRLGYLAASPDLVPYLVRLKQAADLHSNRLSQWLVLQQFHDTNHEQRLKSIADTYRQKRDFFYESLQRHFSKCATWEQPLGGLFFWLKLNNKIDTRLLLPKAIDRGLAFMPGEHFYVDANKPCGALRLNFSHASETECNTGLKILSSLIREFGY